MNKISKMAGAFAGLVKGNPIKAVAVAGVFVLAGADKVGAPVSDTFRAVVNLAAAFGS